MSKFTVTKARAKELKRISVRMDREGGGVPLEVAREEWQAAMVAELRTLAKAYVRTRKGGAELLDTLALAEVEGVDPTVLSEIRRALGAVVRKRRAA
jgi:hypothetical protein